MFLWHCAYTHFAKESAALKIQHSCGPRAFGRKDPGSKITSAVPPRRRGLAHPLTFSFQPPFHSFSGSTQNEEPRDGASRSTEVGQVGRYPAPNQFFFVLFSFFFSSFLNTLELVRSLFSCSAAEMSKAPAESQPKITHDTKGSKFVMEGGVLAEYVLFQHFICF